MIVCNCHGTTDREIREAARTGAASCEDVGRRCGAGTGCRGCVSTIRQVLARAQTAKAGTAAPVAARKRS